MLKGEDCHYVIRETFNDDWYLESDLVEKLIPHTNCSNAFSDLSFRTRVLRRLFDALSLKLYYITVSKTLVSTDRYTFGTNEIITNWER